MDGRQFDTFAKTLAGGVNRRSALKMLWGGVAGVAGVAAARGARAGNSDCSEFCKAIYGPGNERGQCISDAANGVGLCVACGGDPASVCTAPDGTLTCQCETCTPMTCVEAGAECGFIANTCGGDPIDCGNPCTAPETCGAVTPNQCGCVSMTCLQVGAECGFIADSCGGPDIDCGNPCLVPETCGAVAPNQCGCAPTTSCEELGFTCGDIFNGCETVSCGTCESPNTCGGGGVENQCGTPAICAACTPAGGSCLEADECCSGHCAGSICAYGEQICRNTGDICSDDIGEECCQGSCSDGCCVCGGPGSTCDGDNACCAGAICVSSDCCNGPDMACSSNADCCGGRCDGGKCSQGPAGTPCRNAGDCINECDTESFLCVCSFDSWCFTDSDCCGDAKCIADPEAAPYTGVCG